MNHRYKSPASHKRQPRRQRGIVLLLTLLVLLILASVIVRFVADTTLSLRAGSYRLQQQQCRYAAESGMIIGSKLISQKILETSQERAKKQAATDPNGTSDQLDTAASDPNDPNKPLPDPNKTAETTVKPEWPPYVIDRQTMDIGEAKVTIEIHDENAKWPLLWVLRPPYKTGARESLGDALQDWARACGADSILGVQTLRLAETVGSGLDLPPAEYEIDPNNASSGANSQNQTSSSRRKGRSRNRKRTTYSQQMAEQEKRHQMMGVFAELWHDQLRRNLDYKDLTKHLRDQDYAYADSLSSWGASQININTAPPDLLADIFGPLGLTKDMANVIAEKRKTQPFNNPAELSDTISLNTQQVEAISRLCVVETDTYSVHVIAQLGRAQYHLQGGLYAHRGKIKNLAVIPGD